ncbi:MAG: cysteine desulfurase, partial [Kiritimatiellia bacterium]
ANHETGVLQPVNDALELCLRYGTALHVDATQAAGKVELDLGGVHGVVLSSHKIGGPGGVGALVLPHGEPFAALLSGGSQERGRRAGTVNTAGVVGFGVACQLAMKELKQRAERWRHLMENIQDLARRSGLRIPSGDAARVPNTVCLVAPGVRGETLVQALDLRGICVSSGAACASGSLRASPVLTAMGEANPHGALRISLGPRSSDADVNALIAALPEILRALREPDPFDFT